MFDSGYIEKMVFIVGYKVAFHLRRVHATIRLRNVDHWKIQVGKDVNGHSNQSQDRTQSDSNDHNNDCDWPPHRKIDQPHSYSFFRTVPVAASCKKGFRSPRALAAARRARQTLSLATESSISACVKSRSASATSVMLASCAWYRARALTSASWAALSSTGVVRATRMALSIKVRALASWALRVSIV